MNVVTSITKRGLVVCLVAIGFFVVEVQGFAASFDSMKESVTSGDGKLVHPNLYRELTEEEKEMYQKFPDPPTQINRTMTTEEANEYIRFVEKYQAENNTSEVPSEAYDYVQYITEELDSSPSSTITDDLREKAQIYAEEKRVENQNETEKSSKKTEEEQISKREKEKDEEKKPKKEEKKKQSFWKRLITFQWFS